MKEELITQTQISRRNWRSTVVGAILVLTGLGQIVVDPKRILDPTTTGLLAGGAALILGTDKLLGFAVGDLVKPDKPVNKEKE